METTSVDALQRFAITSEGPRALAVGWRGGTVHDLLDEPRSERVEHAADGTATACPEGSRTLTRFRSQRSAPGRKPDEGTPRVQSVFLF